MHTHFAFHPAVIQSIHTCILSVTFTVVCLVPLQADVTASIQENILELNQNRTPTHYIRDYAVFEHLGSGAFGSVYKVRKRGGQTFLALKEV